MKQANRKSITVTAFMLLLLAGVFAQTNKTTQAVSPQTLRKVSFWERLPKSTGYISDFERLFSPTQKERLETIAATFKDETGIQLAVVTLDTFSTPKEKFDSLARHIGKAWAVGDSVKDDGIVIAISRGFRLVRIVHGKGLNKLVTSTETKRIIDNYFLPSYRDNYYYEGTQMGMEGLIQLLRLKIKQTKK